MTIGELEIKLHTLQKARKQLDTLYKKSSVAWLNNGAIDKRNIMGSIDHLEREIARMEKEVIE